MNRFDLHAEKEKYSAEYCVSYNFKTGMNFNTSSKRGLLYMCSGYISATCLSANLLKISKSKK